MNFAHGDFMMVGMFLTFFLNQGLGLSPTWRCRSLP